MCTTLPPVLVTVLGIEKLVPSLRRPRGLPPAAAALVDRRAHEPVHVALDRASRPATGPRSCTSSCSTRPHARAAPTRSAARRSRCIRCSACLNVCPVYSRTGGHAYGSVYPGPIGAILTPQLRGIEHAPSLPFASSLCGACYEVCPVKIDIPGVLLHLRARAVRGDASRATRRLRRCWRRTFAHARRLPARRSARRRSPPRLVRARRSADAPPAAALGAGRARATCRPLRAKSFRDVVERAMSDDCAAVLGARSVARSPGAARLRRPAARPRVPGTGRSTRSARRRASASAPPTTAPTCGALQPTSPPRSPRPARARARAASSSPPAFP